RDLAGVFAGVGEATVQALFLVGEGDHADRARRTLGQVRDEPGRGHGDADAGGVVDRPGALVPGIQVAADQHDLVGPAAAGDLADHVLRGVFAVPAAIQRHAYARAGIERDQARELVGVRVGEGGGGNRLQALGETGDAGMPEALVAGAGRAHQEGAGTGADRRGGAGAAQARGRAVEGVGGGGGEGGGGSRLRALGEGGEAGAPEAWVAGAGGAQGEGAGPGGDRRGGAGAARAGGRAVAVPVAGTLHAVVHERD